MKKLIVNLAVFLFTSSLGFSQGSADVVIKPVAPFELFRDSVHVDSVSKPAFLSDFDAHNFEDIYTGNESYLSSYSDFTGLNNEQQFISFSITNLTDTEKTYNVYVDLPEAWNVQIRRRVLLNDFYKSPLAYDYVLFFGDALPLLEIADGKSLLTLHANETVRLFIDFKINIAALTSGFYKTKTTIHLDDKYNTTRKWSKIINMNLYNIAYPAQDTICFNSIVYNSDNATASGQRSDFWENTGFSSLLLNVPIIQEGIFFDATGNPVDSAGNPIAITPDVNCRQKIINWVPKDNKEILIFWERYYETLCKKRSEDGGGYLVPYSPAWNKALSLMISAVYIYAKSQNGDIDSSDIVFYAYDELHSNYSEGISSDVQGVATMLSDLEGYVPAFKKMISYTSFSFIKDVKATAGLIDIAVTSLVIKDSLTGDNSFGAPSSYRPKNAFRDSIYPLLYQRQSVDSLEIQNYLPCQGKTESTNTFRMAPIVTRYLYRYGLSWYGFKKGGASTWYARDGNALDYSLAYEKETGNPLHDFWNKEEEYIVPSIRTKAITASKQDVEIYAYLKKNYSLMSVAQKNSLDSIEDVLDTYLDPAYDFLLKPTKELNVFNYENKVSKPLRRIFANYNGITTVYTGALLKENKNPDSLDISVSANNIVEIYPNPAQDKINFIVKSPGTYIQEYTIFDARGNIVLKESGLNSEKISKDISRLNSGLYFVKIKIDKNIVTGKITKY